MGHRVNEVSWGNLKDGHLYEQQLQYTYQDGHTEEFFDGVFKHVAGEPGSELSSCIWIFVTPPRPLHGVVKKKFIFKEIELKDLPLYIGYTVTKEGEQLLKNYEIPTTE